MLVRFFAGAAEAAGVDERQVDVSAQSSGHALVALLAEGNDHLGAVLAVSALLADGVRIADRSAPLGEVTQLDVLPPFAGG